MASKPSWLRKFTVLMMVFAIVLTYSIVPVNQSFAASKKPTKITVKATTKTVDVKGKATIKVTKVTPKGASTAVKYKSSNKKVATVNSKGVVTGKKKGTVKITVTSKANKKLKKTIKIKVKNIKPKKIKLSASKLSLEPGKKAVLTAKATPEGVYAPVTWKSSNTKVATVDKKGNVKAVAAGTAKITVATTKASGKVVKATCTVTVKKATPAAPAEEPAQASEKAPTLNNANVRTMTTSIDMSDAKYDGNVVRVWVPVPQTNDEQTIWGESYKAPAADTDKSGFKTESSSGWNNKMLYLEWSADTDAADRKATLTFNVSRYEVSRSDLQEDAKAAIPDDVKPYITKESNYVKVNDPIVQKYAAEATKGKTGTLEKARAIYDWCIANLERIDNGEKLEGTDGQLHEFTILGCGYGDTVQILKDHEEFGRAGGHCTDINSTFVALCRASGIPAREMFGIRLADDATGGQHCWAQFYLPGTGWVYADAGDVLKFGVKENKAGLNMTLAQLEAARKTDLTAEYTAKYWGGVDNNRVELSRGRDIILEPASAADDGAPYNTFGYPCGEFGTEADGFTRIECTDAKNFTYKISCVDVAASADEVSAVIDGTDTATKLVDARTADAFEGWAIDGAVNGGHLKNAVNVAAQWLTTAYSSVPAENKTREESIQKDIDANGIAKNDKIIVYDTNGEDAVAVMNYLASNGYTDVAPYDATEEFKTASNVEANEAYTDYYVPAEIVKSISDNIVSGTALSDEAKAVVGSKNAKILHAEYWGVRDSNGDVDFSKPSKWGSSDYYATGHVPGAIPVSTDDYEPEVQRRTDDDIIRQDGVTYGNNADISWVGDYLLVNDEDAIKLAEKSGITKDDCVIVVGYEPMASCKIALVLKYLGVDSTYVMSAAYNEWNIKGYELEKNVVNKSNTAEFGTDSPLNPDLIDTQDEAAAMLEEPDKYQLVDTRTVEEFAGTDTGYSYHDIAGRIPGADVNSPSGIGYSSGMYFYRNADKTMRSKSVIEAMWKDQGVDTSKHVSFFCGSGWRAAEETWDALAMGYKNVSMYNDGWQGWSNAGRPFIDKDGNELKLVEGNLVKDIDVKYSYVTAKELISDIISDDPQYTIIDVRQAKDESNKNMGSYEDAHIVTSISAPAVSNDYTTKLSYKETAANLEAAGVSKDSGKKYVMVCYYGGEIAERAVTIAATYMGVPTENLLILDGGQWSLDPEWSFMSDNPYEAPEYLIGTGTSNGGVAYDGVTPEQLKTDIEGPTDLYRVIDVRATGDYDTAHIPTALTAAVKTGKDDTDASNINAAVSAYGTNAVYCLICYSGNAYADVAQDLLIKAGVPANRIVRLVGGHNAWAKANYPTYSVDRVEATTVEQLEGYKVVDVRRAGDYDTRHIEGAVSAPVLTGDFAQDVANVNAILEDGADYMLICYSGNAYARRAQTILEQLEVDADKIHVLKDGDNGWNYEAE